MYSVNKDYVLIKKTDKEEKLRMHIGNGTGFLPL